MDILKIENVYKRFGDYAASNNISLSVEAGSVFGLLGPNGAGKTTLIRMITNILMPDEGRITLLGDIVGSSQQNNIGYLPEERGLYKKLKVIEQLVYFGRLKGMTQRAAMQSAKAWLAKLDAASWALKKIQELSKGMQQKVQFISTILHNPDVLILDEPFSGFDPINVEILKQIILEMKKDGKTIILSTHVMEQAEQLCDNICLIDKGKVVLSGKLRDIKRSFGRDTILMEFTGDGTFLDEFPDITIINKTDSRAEFRVSQGFDQAREILKKAIETNEIYKFEFIEPSLNEIFIDVVKRQEQLS